MHVEASVNLSVTILSQTQHLSHTVVIGCSKLSAISVLRRFPLQIPMSITRAYVCDDRRPRVVLLSCSYCPRIIAVRHTTYEGAFDQP